MRKATQASMQFIQRAPAPFPDELFTDVVQGMQATLAKAVAGGDGHLFFADTPNLTASYLATFNNPGVRQYHNCRCCLNFLQRYGSLVTIDSKGNPTSAVWDEHTLPAGHPYRQVVVNMRRHVEEARVAGQFFAGDLFLGVPEQGGFNHFHLQPKHVVPRADNRMALALENFRTLNHALAELPSKYVDQVIEFCDMGVGLAGAQALVPLARFLQNAHNALHLNNRNAPSGRAARHDAIVWRFVAQARPGWCTPRSSVLGAIIEDLKSGRPADAAIAAHNVRMDPKFYLRPQAPTTAGNASQANTLVNELGLESALRRRPAMLSEVRTMWRPRDQINGSTGGVFDKLVPERRRTAVTQLNRNVLRVTLSKFIRDVLPKALGMELVVPMHGSFGALTTQADPSAQPLMRWDTLEQRNPFCWYTYLDGSRASQWCLPTIGDMRVAVTGVASMPDSWANEGLADSDHRTVLFMLKGASDPVARSAMLFPQCLRNELHPVRRTIEAHSKANPLEPLVPGTPAAAGLFLGENCKPTQVYVWTRVGMASYLIDTL